VITIKSEREIELMAAAGKINTEAHKLAEKHLKPGVTTKQIDDIIKKFVIDNGAYPSCLNYEGFPGAACISVDDEVVHGIPSNRKLKNGDIVKLDFTVRKDGYESDMTRTYIIGEVSKEIEDLVKNTYEALQRGIAMVKPGNHIGDISHAIEEYAHEHGLGVVEELVGHGIGTEMHEDPDVPNFGEAGKGPVLKKGMVIAIEPMLNLGTKHVVQLDDGWTIVTEDGKYSAHFEDTVAVTEDGHRMLTGE